MSSYEVGNVGIDGGVLAGAAAIAAAAALIAPAAIIGGAGYAFYKFGLNLKEGLEQQHKDAVDREAKRIAEETVRWEMAKARLLKATDDAKMLLGTIENEKLSIGGNAEVCDRLERLREQIYGLIVNTRLSETADMEYEAAAIAKSAKEVREELKRLSQQNANIIKNKNVALAIDKLGEMIAGLKVEDYGDITDIVAANPSEEKRNEYLKRVRALAVKVKEILYKEIKRFERIPIRSVDIESLAHVLKGIDAQIYELLAGQIELERYETKIRAIEKRLEEYDVLRALMDKEEGAFLSAYYSYIAACEKVSINAKDIMDFDSYDELKAEIDALSEKLQKMEKCAQLVEKLGKETYMCMAFEYELKQLEYDALSKDESEQILYRELVNASVGEKRSPYYTDEKENLMQMYKTGEGMYVQVQIHKDGSTSIETICDKKTSMGDAIESQKKHCNKSKRLENALRNNWFIETDIVEVKSPQTVSYVLGSHVTEGEKARKEAGLAKQDLMSRARKETERRRKEKAQLRAKALRG